MSKELISKEEIDKWDEEKAQRVFLQILKLADRCILLEQNFFSAEHTHECLSVMAMFRKDIEESDYIKQRKKYLDGERSTTISKGSHE